MSQPPSQHPSLSPHLRMLIVDEATYLSRLDRQGFRDKGVLVYSTDNSAAALKVLQTKSINVISVNLDFAQGKGLQILKHLLATTATETYLWVTTSIKSYDTTTARDVLAMGVGLFIQLPISKEFFIKKIREALGGAPRQAERTRLTGAVTFNLSGSKITTNLREISPQAILVDNLASLQHLRGEPLDLIIAPDAAMDPIETVGTLIRISTCQQFLALALPNLSADQQQRIHNLMKQLKHPLHAIASQHG